MSTTGKSRLVLFLMAVIAVVFFVTSFVAAALSSNTAGTTAASPGVPASDCIIARSADGRTLGECSFSAP
jgi:hypothetical protein